MIRRESQPIPLLEQPTDTPRCGSRCSLFRSWPLSSSCARASAWLRGAGWQPPCAFTIHRWVLWGSCSILVVANVINIGADLGGMAEASQLITGVRPLIWIPVYACFIIGLLV